MKLLLLNAYYYPEIISSFYITENRLDAFSKADIQMEMLVPIPSRNIDNSIREKYKNKFVEWKYDGKLKVRRFPLYKESENLLLKGFRYLLISLNHLIRGLFIKNVDCIFCTSTPPTTGIVASLLKKLKRTRRFVYNLQDIFPDSLVAIGYTNKKSILWRLGSKIESFIYRNADCIIVISEDFRKNLLAKGVPDEKIEVVYNWVDGDVVKPVKKEDNSLYKQFAIPKNKFTVVYAGNMGYAQNIQIIIDVAKQLSQYNMQFLLFGKGPLKDEIEEEVKNSGLKNILFLPFQPYEKVSSVYSLGDVSIVSCKKGLGGSAMPSKTWSIMASGTAVIASFDSGELKNIIETYECGTFSEPDNIESLKEAILKYYENAELCKKHGENGVLAVTKYFSREVGTKKYLDIIQNA